MFETKNVHEDIFRPSHKIPVIVQFYTDWCGPCPALKPTVSALAEKAKGK